MGLKKLNWLKSNNFKIKEEIEKKPESGAKVRKHPKRKYLNLNILVSTIIISGLHVVGLDNNSHIGFINNLTIIYKRYHWFIRI